MPFVELIESMVISADVIYSAFSQVLSFFSLPFVDVLNSVLLVEGFLGVPGAFILSFITNTLGPLIGTYSLFNLMFGVGLPIIIAITLLSWVIDILP